MLLQRFPGERELEARSRLKGVKELQLKKVETVLQPPAVLQ